MVNYKDFLIIDDAHKRIPLYGTESTEGKRYTLIPVKGEFKLFEAPVFGDNLVSPIIFPISVLKKGAGNGRELKRAIKTDLENMKNEIAVKFLSLLAREWNVPLEKLFNLKKKTGSACPFLMTIFFEDISVFDFKGEQFGYGLCNIGFLSVLPKCSLPLQNKGGG